MIVEETKRAALFLDPEGTLLTRVPEEGWRRGPDAESWLMLRHVYRLGILWLEGGASSTNARTARQVLDDEDVYSALDPDLVLTRAEVSVAPPDPRAFLVAAALAGASVEQCVFVSCRPWLLAAAAAAGMKTVSVAMPSVAPSGKKLVPEEAPQTLAVPSLLSIAGDAEDDEALPAPVVATLLAGEIDPDVGATYVLVGRVVTMNSRGDVFSPGQVAIQNGKVAAVLPADAPLPAALAQAPRIETGGTIYPGLIDLHNHFVYNVIPLWQVPRQYSNRTQWPRHREYAAQISLPLRTLAAYATTSRALVRYVETKAIVGGTTTGQGIRTQINGSRRLFHGVMRNVEETDDSRLPEASTRVPNLGSADSIESFRRSLERNAACFYHLAEGTDNGARETFFDLVDNNLVQPPLIGIHSLGLAADDLKRMADGGAKIVWSPFSNLLLYGSTLRLNEVIESGVPFSIGCDWAPSGSKNLLQELKVARFEVQRQGVNLTSEALVRTVTSKAAEVVGWSSHLGVLKPAMFADVLVIAGEGGDPYDHLIDATEAGVRLVLVHGVPRYGDQDLMERLPTDPARPLELLTVMGVKKALFLYAEGSGLEDLTFTQARAILTEAMSDLPGFRTRMEQQNAGLLSFGLTAPQPFTLLLDNEYEPSAEELATLPADSGLLADWNLLAESVELDSIEVSSDSYWLRIDAAPNISPELKEMLKNAYSG